MSYQTQRSPSDEQHQTRHSDVILASVKQQELLFKKLTRQLERDRGSAVGGNNGVDKKSKRRSFSVYETSNRNAPVDSYDVSNHKYIHNQRRRASSSLGLPLSAHKTNIMNEYGGAANYDVTTHQQPQQHHHHQQHHNNDGWEIPHQLTRHQYDVISNEIDSSKMIFHHNYQEHVNRLMQLQQQQHIDEPPRIPPPHHHLQGTSYMTSYQPHTSSSYYQHADYYGKSPPPLLPPYSPHPPNTEIGMENNGRMKYHPQHHNNHHNSTTPIHHHQHNISPSSSYYPPSFHPSSPLHASPPSRDHPHHLSRDQCHPHHHHNGSRDQYLMKRNHPTRNSKISSDNLFINDNSVSVKISEIIDMLNDCSYQTVSNAAAYIQHLSYGDDVMKSLLRKKGVIPTLIGLLRHNILEIQRNACGALRNMIYGRRNNEGKILVANYGGISSLCYLLESTTDIELKELCTGVLWNLSSCGQLKYLVADTSLRVLANNIVIKYVCIIEPIKMSHYISHHHHHDCHDNNIVDLNTSDVTIQPYWSTLFINATGCLRNMSSGGSEVRKKLRNFDGLIEALLLVVENVIGKNDIDCRGVENCMCILRNLSYHLSSEVELANQPINEQQQQLLSTTTSSSSDNNAVDCWKLYRKKDKKKTNEHETLSILMNSSNIHGVELLWHPSVVRRYLALLAETCNNGTLEAAAGALQNLSAGNWRWSANIRTAVRKVKGLPMLVEFLNMENDRIVTVICSTLRNMSIDARNKQLIGKHAMIDFVRLLPEVDLQSIHNNTVVAGGTQVTSVVVTSSWEKLEAACVCIKELITSSYENANQLYSLGGVPALISVSRNQNNSYPLRIVKIVGKVLACLWEYKQIRTQIKQDGWNKQYFIPTQQQSSQQGGGGGSSDVTFSDSSQITPFGSSPPNSPYHTTPQQYSFDGGNHDNSNNYVVTSSQQYSPTRYKQQQPLLRHHPQPPRHTIMTSSPNPHHNGILDSWV